MTASKLYLALVHHPIVNKRGDTITTSVTNLDLHDIARSCRTFGFKQYFVVTPIEAQHKLLDRILGYWKTDDASDYNPDRQDALGLIRVVDKLSDAVDRIEQAEGREPIVATTRAKEDHPSGSCQDLINMSRENHRPILLLLGTGWGLHPSIIEQADLFCPLYRRL